VGDVGGWTTPLCYRHGSGRRGEVRSGGRGDLQAVLSAVEELRVGVQHLLRVVEETLLRACLLTYTIDIG
jgi:hypothetical protein